jgi:hypothetical protein
MARHFVECRVDEWEIPEWDAIRLEADGIIWQDEDKIERWQHSNPDSTDVIYGVTGDSESPEEEANVRDIAASGGSIRNLARSRRCSWRAGCFARQR